MITARQVYSMLGNGPFWETALRCHQILEDSQIPHAVMGGVAVCLHGYQRNTVDLDLLVRREDFASIEDTLEDHAGFRRSDGIAVQLLVAGDRAGVDSDVCLPDPAERRTVTQLEGLPVLTLARLIESKIACGLGNLRRTHKDFADVVELIIQHRLNSSFARFLHKSLRSAFRTLVQNSRGKS